MVSEKTVSVWEKFKALSRTSLSSGVLALFVIILALLLLNSFIQDSGNKASNPEQKQEQTENFDGQTKLENREPSKSRPQTHLVSQGENLSKIAEKYYRDKNKWAVIAAENNIANPNLIEIGVNLTIPDLDNQTSSITTSNQTEELSSDQPVIQPKTYTVVAGDTLWEISQRYYNGDGYQWFKIRDANPREVGLLPNGRPLITPGTDLIIPNL